MQTGRPWFKSLVSSTTALILAAAFAPALASDTGFYVGLDLGLSQYPDNEALRLSPDLVLSGSGSSLNDEDTAWGVRAGYQLNPYFAVEAGYLDLGESSGTLVSGAPGGSAFSTFTLSAAGPTLAFVGKWPLGKWEPYLRLGVLFADTELSFRGTDGTTVLAGTVSDSTEEVFGGLGIAYRFNERWRARAELTFLDDVSTATVGLTYRF
jgi:Outer membrane protein beta-barrel domain